MCHLFDLGFCKNLQELNLSDCPTLTVSMRSFFYCCYIDWNLQCWSANTQRCCQNTCLCAHLGLNVEKKQTMFNIGKKFYPIYIVLLLIL